MTTPRPGISSEGSLQQQIVLALVMIWPVTSQWYWYDVCLKDLSSCPTSFF